MEYASTQYRVRRGALSGFDSLIRAHGGSLADLLTSCGMAERDLDFPEERMAVTDLVALLNAAGCLPGLQQSGLQLAAVQGLEVIGVLGRLLLEAETLGDAFTLVNRYMTLHNQGERWRITDFGHCVAVQRYEHVCFDQDARQYHELSLGNCLRLMEILAGCRIQPVRVEFVHRPLAAEADYRRFFRCDVRFGEEQDQLLISKEVLTLPVSVRNDAGSVSADFIDRLSQQYPDDLRAQVKTVIMQLLGSGRHSIEDVALLLDLHPRTLQRRLAEDSIVFRQLLNEVRSNLACWHLTSSDIDITRLSAALGYSDVSGFSRAFHQWHGCSPRHWRNQRIST